MFDISVDSTCQACGLFKPQDTGLLQRFPSFRKYVSRGLDVRSFKRMDLKSYCRRRRDNNLKRLGAYWLKTNFGHWFGKMSCRVFRRWLKPLWDEFKRDHPHAQERRFREHLCPMNNPPKIGKRYIKMYRPRPVVDFASVTDSELFGDTDLVSPIEQGIGPGLDIDSLTSSGRWPKLDVHNPVLLDVRPIRGLTHPTVAKQHFELDEAASTPFDRSRVEWESRSDFPPANLFSNLRESGKGYYNPSDSFDPSSGKNYAKELKQPRHDPVPSLQAIRSTESSVKPNTGLFDLMSTKPNLKKVGVRLHHGYGRAGTSDYEDITCQHPEHLLPGICSGCLTTKQDRDRTSLTGPTPEPVTGEALSTFDAACSRCNELQRKCAKCLFKL
jgi:hypothetical protein